jgi:hypothetical protein
MEALAEREQEEDVLRDPGAAVHQKGESHRKQVQSGIELLNFGKEF